MAKNFLTVVFVLLCSFTTIQAHLIFDLDGDKKLQASQGVWLPRSSKTPKFFVSKGIWSPHKTDLSKFVIFDINGDKFPEQTEWVGSNDGLLLIYKKEKKISGNNFFGKAGGFKNGFEKLKGMFDKDKNFQLEGNELKELSIWRDKNGNAKIDKGEIASLLEMGITKIYLNYYPQLTSLYVQNGKEKYIWDWHPNYTFAKRKRPKKKKSKKK